MPLPSPSFAGTSLGYAVKMQTFAREVARQINSYPGVNGLEVLNMGSRGGTTNAEGVLYGNTLDEISTLMNQFINYQRDGGAYTLVDSKGTSWSTVILQSFKPASPVMPSWGGGYAQQYTAEFLHVI